MSPADPGDVARISYEATRPVGDGCCPPFDELDEGRREGMVASTAATLDALAAAGYEFAEPGELARIRRELDEARWCVAELGFVIRSLAARSVAGRTDIRSRLEAGIRARMDAHG